MNQENEKLMEIPLHQWTALCGVHKNQADGVNGTLQPIEDEGVRCDVPKCRRKAVLEFIPGIQIGVVKTKGEKHGEEHASESEQKRSDEEKLGNKESTASPAKP